jgi:ribosomal protein S25
MAKKKKNSDEDIVVEEKVEEKIDKVEVEAHTKKLNKKYGKVATVELKQRDPYIPRLVETQIREGISKMRAITPNELAARYDIRVSAIKKLLLTLEDEGKLVRISSSSRLKVFNPVE